MTYETTLCCGTKPDDGYVQENEESGISSSSTTSKTSDFRANFFKQYAAAVLVTIGSFSAGTFLSWTSSALPLLRADSNIVITKTDESWIASLLNLGACVGAIPTGLIAEKFGRRMTLLCLAFPIFISWFLIAMRTCVICLYVGRFVGGISVGALSVAIPTYVVEMAQPRIKASLAHFSQVQLSAGILVGYIAGFCEDVTIQTCILLIFPALYVFGFIFMPESPVYLVTQGKDLEAKNSLSLLRESGYDVDEEISSIKNYIQEATNYKDGSFKDLISPSKNAKVLIIAVIMTILHQMTGITTIIFYLGSILEHANVCRYMIVVIGGIQVFSTYLAAYFFIYTGRKKIMIISSIMMALSFMVLGVYFHLRDSDVINIYYWIPVICLSVYVSFYSIGIGPICCLMIRELFPTKLRKKATALTSGLNWFVAFLMTAMFNRTLDHIQIGWILCNYSFVCMFFALFICFFIHEKRNKYILQVKNVIQVT